MKEHGHSEGCQRCDAEAVMSVKGSPSGTEFELKVAAYLVNTEAVDRTQARPVFVMSFHRAVRVHARVQGTKPHEQEPGSEHMTKGAEHEN